jgi:hypothetical protein
VIVIGSADQRLLQDTLTSSSAKSTDSMLIRIGDSSDRVDPAGTGGSVGGAVDSDGGTKTHHNRGHNSSGLRAPTTAGIVY